jgi:hypothetical protein
MELADFAVQIEEVMAEVTTEYECIMLDDNDIGVLWHFILEDAISGYIAVEENETYGDIKTVNLGLHLKDITDASKSELMELLEINGELINANFSVIKYPVNDPEEEEGVPFIEEGEDIDYDTPEEPELRDLLIIQSRVPFEVFTPDDFDAFVNNLMFQADMFLNGDEMDESESL